MLQICAERPGLLTAPDGFALNASADFTALEQADIVVVPYWGAVHQRPPQSLLDSPVRARENGAEIVGLCLGAFVLGYAGLLDGKRAATHWEFEQAFQRQFPEVRLDINALYVDDQRIITSAGTAAALDCCLYIIRQRFGSLAANQIARRMIVPPHREGAVRSLSPSRYRKIPATRGLTACWSISSSISPNRTTSTRWRRW